MGNDVMNRGTDIAKAKATTHSPSQTHRSTEERTSTPRASVFETGDAVILELEMPGVARDAIDVSVENDELTVQGRRIFPVDEGSEFLHQERLPLNYRRSFILSERIDGGKIAAKYSDGVLRLTLPKSAEAKPRKITID